MRQDRLDLLAEHGAVGRQRRHFQRIDHVGPGVEHAVVGLGESRNNQRPPGLAPDGDLSQELLDGNRGADPLLQHADSKETAPKQSVQNQQSQENVRGIRPPIHASLRPDRIDDGWHERRDNDGDVDDERRVGARPERFAP